MPAFFSNRHASSALTERARNSSVPDYGPLERVRISGSSVAGLCNIPHVARLEQSLESGRTLGLGGFALLLARQLIDRRSLDRAQHAHDLWKGRLERGQGHRQRDAVAVLVVQYRAVGRALLESKSAADAQALVPGFAVDERLA